MIFDVYIECWFESGVHGNSIMTLHLCKGKNICKEFWIEMNIECEQVQWWSFCVILNVTICVESCGDVFILDVINKLRIINDADGRTGIKEYPTDGN